MWALLVSWNSGGYILKRQFLKGCAQTGTISITGKLVRNSERPAKQPPRSGMSLSHCVKGYLKKKRQFDCIEVAGFLCDFFTNFLKLRHHQTSLNI